MNRPQLKDCLSYLRDGDTLHVHSIDRLARNLTDLETIVHDLMSKGVAVHFHKENLIFSGQEGAMQRLLFQLLGAVGQFERSLIRERQAEGIRAAQRRGQKLGRPSKLTTIQKEELRTRVAMGDPKQDLAREYGISRQTVYDLLKVSPVDGAREQSLTLATEEVADDAAH